MCGIPPPVALWCDPLEHRGRNESPVDEGDLSSRPPEPELRCSVSDSTTPLRSRVVARFSVCSLRSEAGISCQLCAAANGVAGDRAPAACPRGSRARRRFGIPCDSRRNSTPLTLGGDGSASCRWGDRGIDSKISSRPADSPCGRHGISCSWRGGVTPLSGPSIRNAWSRFLAVCPSSC
jgi:hypothetical protein